MTKSKSLWRREVEHFLCGMVAGLFPWGWAWGSVVWIVKELVFDPWQDYGIKWIFNVPRDRDHEYAWIEVYPDGRNIGYQFASEEKVYYRDKAWIDMAVFLAGTLFGFWLMRGAVILNGGL